MIISFECLFKSVTQMTSLLSQQWFWCGFPVTKAIVITSFSAMKLLEIVT